MRILVTGASGLVGSKLIPLLKAQRHEIVTVSRRAPRDSSERQWDFTSTVTAGLLDGVEAIVHLAGENIGDGRWSVSKKQKIRESRVQGTRLLSESASALRGSIKTLVCASAIGYYGDRGAEELTEESPPGSGFLPDVCREWEAATEPASECGIRVVNLRLGVVLSRSGGALGKMLLPFQLGVGGVVGSGSQYWSWLTVDDAASIFRFAVENERLSGPVNAVAPMPATNREFTKALGRVLRRPTIFPLPAFAARLALGEMADELILGSTRVLPKKLEAAGYTFLQPTLELGLVAALQS